MLGTWDDALHGNNVTELIVPDVRNMVATAKAKRVVRKTTRTDFMSYCLVFAPEGCVWMRRGPVCFTLKRRILFLWPAEPRCAVAFLLRSPCAENPGLETCERSQNKSPGQKKLATFEKGRVGSKINYFTKRGKRITPMIPARAQEAASCFREASWNQSRRTACSILQACL